MQNLYVPALYLSSTSDSINLTFGNEEIDNLIKGLNLREFVVFHGSKFCNVIAEILCVRGQLPICDGGLDSPVIFIDGGNIFDPYLISETAVIYGISPAEILKKVWVSRAFNAYQLTALISDKLEPIIERIHPKLIIISNLDSLYCDSVIGTCEAKNIFNHITFLLRNMAKKKNLVVVTTSLYSNSMRKKSLEQYLFNRASLLAKIEGGNPYLTIDLEKHPAGHSGSVKISLGNEELAYQSLLEDFAEA